MTQPTTAETCLHAPDRANDPRSIPEPASVAPSSDGAEWRKRIVVTLTSADGERFHRLSSGEILDDQGRAGADFVPDRVVDSLTPNVRPATAAEIASPGPCASFLDLLCRRTAIVETIIGPSPEDDAPRLDVVADLERQMIATPPRTTEEVAAALAVVRDEICDGFLMSDTVEDFLVMIVEAASAFLIDRRHGNERASEGDAPPPSPSSGKIIDLCAEWHALFNGDWPDTGEFESAICRRLTSIEEELAEQVPASIRAAVAMMGVVLTNGDDVGSGTHDLEILRAVATGLTRMSTDALPV